MVACAFCLDITSVGECPSDVHYDAIIALNILYVCAGVSLRILSPCTYLIMWLNVRYQRQVKRDTCECH